MALIAGNPAARGAMFTLIPGHTNLWSYNRMGNGLLIKKAETMQDCITAGGILMIVAGQEHAVVIGGRAFLELLGADKLLSRYRWVVHFQADTNPANGDTTTTRLPNMKTEALLQLLPMGTYSGTTFTAFTGNVEYYAVVTKCQSLFGMTSYPSSTGANANSPNPFSGGLVGYTPYKNPKTEVHIVENGGTFVLNSTTFPFGPARASVVAIGEFPWNRTLKQLIMAAKPKCIDEADDKQRPYLNQAFSEKYPAKQDYYPMMRLVIGGSSDPGGANPKYYVGAGGHTKGGTMHTGTNANNGLSQAFIGPGAEYGVASNYFNGTILPPLHAPLVTFGTSVIQTGKPMFELFTQHAIYGARTPVYDMASGQKITEVPFIYDLDLLDYSNKARTVLDEQVSPIDVPITMDGMPLAALVGPVMPLFWYEPTSGARKATGSTIALNTMVFPNKAPISTHQVTVTLDTSTAEGQATAAQLAGTEAVRRPKVKQKSAAFETWGSNLITDVVDFYDDVFNRASDLVK